MNEKDQNSIRVGVRRIYNFFDVPVTFFKEKIVEPNQKKYPWYHETFRRVPNIDECYSDDPLCHYEANCQFLRDRMVDTEILVILRNRATQCDIYHEHDRRTKCKFLWDSCKEAENAWYMKYGELGQNPNVLEAYMKQKHRMIWERRHGPIGTGMKEKLPNE